MRGHTGPNFHNTAFSKFQSRLEAVKKSPREQIQLLLLMRCGQYTAGNEQIKVSSSPVLNPIRGRTGKFTNPKGIRKTGKLPVPQFPPVSERGHFLTRHL
jgi:hypothetical protein